MSKKQTFINHNLLILLHIRDYGIVCIHISTKLIYNLATILMTQGPALKERQEFCFFKAAQQSVEPFCEKDGLYCESYLRSYKFDKLMPYNRYTLVIISSLKKTQFFT